ncbi:MAG: S4 domain-containing protein, partial [Spirochaetota bacterium]
MKVSPFSFVPDATDSSRRLDDLVMARLPSVLLQLGLDAVASKSKLRRLILDGAVSVAGRPVRVPAIVVKPGTVITVYLDPARFAVELTPGDRPFECTPASILYEDEWLIAVNKPPGLPTEGSFLASRDSLHAAVRRFLAARDGATIEDAFVVKDGDDGLPYLGL